MPNLDDITLLKMNALSRVLAAVAIYDPIFILDRLQEIKPEHITDIQVKRFFHALQARRQELATGEYMQKARIMVQAAASSGTLMEYCQWLITSCDYADPIQAGLDAIDEIKRLAITLDELQRLKPFIAECENKSQWR